MTSNALPAITLAPIDVDDAELLHAWWNEPSVAYEWGNWPTPLSAMRERIERDIEDTNQDNFLVLREDGTPVGAVFLGDQSMADGTARIRFLVDPEHRGRGYARAAVDAAVDFAFGELPLYRLDADPHTTNAPALAALAGAGFTHEGVKRSACIHRGRRLDLAVLSLLRPEWEAMERPRSWDR
ncbi:GNAT family N-acetyltransferase [Kitasatospora sp. CB01950]|uniref:GNAT family N-acetyltransferase n=1 Tax=Kitasatospora sp. CB01950 TaxID=1703930 RepID=UPI00093BA033|nr:GNAT family N-acetyltransferase [Kitasatospora sp. CB01950]OKI99140.1 GCN5 family acetyltransferase [Kitasatospora sp. CB01950]